MSRIQLEPSGLWEAGREEFHFPRHDGRESGQVHERFISYEEAVHLRNTLDYWIELWEKSPEDRVGDLSVE